MDLSNAIPKQVRISDVAQSTKFLGRGAFGNVYQGEWHGAQVAVKRLHPFWLRTENGGKSDAFSRFILECERLARIRHPNIVQEMGVCEPSASDESPGLVTELLCCTLRQRYGMDDRPSMARMDEVRIACGVAAGLYHLHSLELIHRDLTTANVMLTTLDTSSENCVAKICDIGCAKLMEFREQGLTADAGTRSYHAPEALGFSVNNGAVKDMRRKASVGEKVWYGMPVDVYSFGVLLMAMVIRREPPDFADLVLQGRHGDIASVPDGHPLGGIISQCLQEESTERDTAGMLVKKLAQVRCELSDSEQVARMAADFNPCAASDDVAALATAHQALLKKDAEITQLQSQLLEQESRARTQDQPGRQDTTAQVIRLRTKLEELESKLASEVALRDKCLEEQAAGYPGLTMTACCTLVLGKRPGSRSPSSVPKWRTIVNLPKKTRVCNNCTSPCIHSGRLYIVTQLKFFIVHTWKIWSLPLNNLRDDAWTEVALPSALVVDDADCHFTLLSHSDWLYCVTNSPKNPKPRIWRRCSSVGWQYLGEAPVTFLRKWHAAIAGGKLLVAGNVESAGAEDSAASVVLSLDVLRTGVGGEEPPVWEKWPPLPHGHEFAEIACGDATVYILCHVHKEHGISPVVMCSSLEGRAWSVATFRQPPLPHCALTVCRDRLVVYGGCHGNAGHQSSGYVYSSHNKSWLALPDHHHRPTPGSLISTDSYLLIAGGYSQASATLKDNVDTSVTLLQW